MSLKKLGKVQQNSILAIAIATYLVVVVCGVFWDTVNWRPKAYDDHERFLNLTTENIKWNASYIKDGKPINLGEFAFPNHGIGEGIFYGANTYTLTTQFQIPTSVAKSNEPLALHFLNFFAKNTEFYVGGTLVHTAQGIFSNNLSLPNSDTSQPIELKIKFNTEGVKEPGFDLRSNILVGPKSDLDRINQETKSRDAQLVIWLVLPRLLIALLFSLAMVFVAYPRDYAFFVGFVILSAIKVATFYGQSKYLFGIQLGNDLLAIHIIDILAQGSLVLFLLRYFRIESQAWAVGVYTTISLAMLSLILSKYISLEASEYFSVESMMFGWRVFAILAGITIVFSAIRMLGGIERNRSRLITAYVMLAALMIALPTLCIYQWTHMQTWLGSFIFEFAFGLIFASCVAIDAATLRGERDTLRQKLGIHVDESVVDELMSAAGPITRRSENCTILFSDIRNFSETCEAHSPEEIMNLLHDYFEILINCAHDHGGFVNKFLGDSVMIVWGIGNDTNNSARNAVKACIKMRDKLEEHSKARQDKGELSVKFSFGIHTGLVVAGHVGNDTRAEFSVIGSAVNIAARLEKLTRQLGCDILISENTLKAIGEGFTTKDFGSHKLRGSKHDIGVYGILSKEAKGQQDPKFPVAV